MGESEPIGLPLQGPAANVTQLAVSAGVGETDNVLLTSTDKESQTLALVGTEFEVRRAAQRLDADLKGDFNYIDYLQNAFHNQLLGRFDGSAGWVLIPEHLRWSVADSFGQAQLDPFAPVTPQNLENVNVVSTGPDLLLRPTSSVFVKIGARYVSAHYERSPFNNSRLLADLSVGTNLSAASSLSLNADYERIRFSDTLINPDYDRRNFYAQYAVRGARTELSLDGGVSQADDLGRWTTSPFARLSITRLLSASSLLQLSAGRQYSDASDSFRGVQSGATGRIAIAPTAGTTENYLNQYGSLLWRFERNRTSLDVSVTGERDTYSVDRLFDVDRVTAEVRFTRRMTSTVRLEVSGHASHERYFEEGFTDNDYLASLALAYIPARRLELRLHYDHESRIQHAQAITIEQGTAPAGTQFAENRAMLTASYRIL